MANNIENLIPNSERTKEERVAIATKGGIASGVARRKKATMLSVLADTLDKEDAKTQLTYRELATLGLIKGAVKGNAQNYKTIIEMLGEVPKEQFNETKEPVLHINITSNEDIKEEFYKEGE